MVSILGNPLIAYQLQLLSEAGISDVVISCGFLHKVIEDFLGDGSAFGVDITYAIEQRPLGRGGALKNALRQMGPQSEPVLALNGDIVTNVNVRELVDAHTRSNKMATLLAVPLRSPYGIVETGENELATRFVEKPELPFWINGGIYVLNPEIESLLPEQGDHETTTFPRLAESGQLSVFKSRALWQAVDTVKDLNEVRAYLERFVFSSFVNFAPPPVPTIGLV
jgi:Nucleoside-diphosphate-sugar pyrophosphorylase involved in lipopolysaccharide biosynthesis/translation initiation factor 2B, gamma/epsilon subunits (eIF-2Bgamma/eIF-2Bepsilon)